MYEFTDKAIAVINKAVQREFAAMVDLIGQAEDAETANRLTGAALKLVRQMEKGFGEV